MLSASHADNSILDSSNMQMQDLSQRQSCKRCTLQAVPMCDLYVLRRTT